MKRWLFDQANRDRSSRSARLYVEPLEGRLLLSATKSSKTTNPAAYKPPPNEQLLFPPYDITAAITSTSDPSGSGYVFQKNVEVAGYTPPFSTVWLAIGQRPGYFTNVTRANAYGYYSIEVPVPNGSTPLELFAEDTAQDYSHVATVQVNFGNAITSWDAIALRAIRNANLDAPEAARDLAILHAAQYDAIADTMNPSQAYAVHLTAPKGASADAAANSSAATVLAALFPAQAPAFAAATSAAVGGLPAGKATTSGLSFGTTVANQELAGRANDGSNATVNLTPSAVPGKWRPTPPSYATSSDAQFAKGKPFVINSPSAFRPEAPPAVGSAAYDQALAQVASLGRTNSTTRTSAQTTAAQFWNDGPGTFTNPGHWNEIADSVAVRHHDSLLKDAKLFAQLDFALADTAIASTDSQAYYDEWRPISAVQTTDPSYTSLVVTPSSPGYVSDDAAYGAAASAVLTATFGSHVKFTDDLYAITGVTRTYSSFAQAAAEDASSRIWGGVNFSFDTQAGANLGTQVGAAVLAGFPRSK
jgi:hypothetical protein